MIVTIFIFLSSYGFTITRFYKNLKRKIRILSVKSSVFRIAFETKIFLVKKHNSPVFKMKAMRYWAP